MLLPGARASTATAEVQVPRLRCSLRSRSARNDTHLCATRAPLPFRAERRRREVEEPAPRCHSERSAKRGVEESALSSSRRSSSELEELTPATVAATDIE